MKRLIHLFVFIGMLGCGSDKDKDVRTMESTFDTFPKTSLVETADTLFKFERDIVNQVHIVSDSILLIHASGIATEYYFYSYSLSDGTLLNEFLAYGNGPGEGLGVATSGVIGDSLWARDVTKSFLIKYPLKELVLKTENYKVYPFDRFYFDCLMVDDSTILGASPLDLMSDAKNSFLLERKNLYTQNVLNGFITMKSEGQTPATVLNEIHRSTMGYNHQSQKVVLAYSYMDAIEIIDLEKNSSVASVSGPDQFLPVYNVRESDNFVQMLVTPNTREAYRRVLTTNSKIYGMYSGNEIKNPSSIEFMNIHVFDWDGKPTNRISFSSPISAFTVDQNNQFLIVIDEEGYVLKIKMELS